jgi:hypothetical protein
MPKEDFQPYHKKHVAYSTKAKAWAKKAVAYMEAGKYEKAKRCEERCQYWLAKCFPIERKFKRRNPHTD